MVSYQRYQKIRDALGLTDYKVSSLADISRTTLSNWKAGRYVPTLTTLNKIAKVLDVPICELIGEV